MALLSGPLPVVLCLESRRNSGHKHTQAGCLETEILKDRKKRERKSFLILRMCVTQERVFDLGQNVTDFIRWLEEAVIDLHR